MRARVCVCVCVRPCSCASVLGCDPPVYVFGAGNGWVCVGVVMDSASELLHYVTPGSSKTAIHSLFTLRRPVSPLRINGEQGLLRVNRLYLIHLIPGIAVCLSTLPMRSFEACSLSDAIVVDEKKFHTISISAIVAQVEHVPQKFHLASISFIEFRLIDHIIYSRACLLCLQHVPAQKINNMLKWATLAKVSVAKTNKLR